jgi:tRNA(Ile)-lysidine synthase
MNSSWNGFEHRVWNSFKEFDLNRRESFVVACSGGLDSMVLLDLICRLKPQAEIKVAHFHHGPAKDQKQLQFRDQALECVKHKISTLNHSNLKLYFEKSEILLNSEEEMRNARWAFIRSCRESDEPILTAHHLDDWFETLMLKMLRGTSLDGLQTFQFWNQEILRPFLNNSKSDLKQQATDRKIEWVEDPSNQSESYLRNWLREKWFKDLESQYPGALQNFSLSMQRVMEEATQVSHFEIQLVEQQSKLGLNRAWYTGLSRPQQIRALALYLKSQQIFDFTLGQLQEINKRLDKNQKDITFVILQRKWVINASQIMLD